MKDNYARIVTRIGYVSNQEDDCNTPDSFIGLGSTNRIPDSTTYLPKISCGNVASWQPDNGNQSLATMGLILV